MKKYLIIILISLPLLLCFTACGREPEEPADVIEDMSESNNTSSLTSPVSEENEDILLNIDHETESPPHPGMERSRITNQWVSAETAATRPIAIIVPNSRTASQYGLSQAAVLYECNVEGSMTRLMAVWDDWSGFDKIGNIRSTRDYYVYWALEWDAFFIHYGGTYYSDAVLSRAMNIDCLPDSSASFRQPAKNTVDNAFTNTDTILKAIESRAYSLNYRDGFKDKPHFMFAAPGRQNTLRQYSNAVDAAKIDLSSTYPVTNCYFEYNDATDLYERFQHLSGEGDGPHLDLMNGEQLTFTNVIVQYTYYEQRDQQGYLAFQCHDNTRGGWFFTHGKGIRITWEKLRDEDPTRYFDENGNEIELNTGKTMILIVQDGDSILIDGKKDSNH